MDVGQKDQALGRAIGKIPSGVYILAVRAGNETSAVMASWVQQAGFEPPSLSVALAKERPAYDLIRRGGVFALSVLADGDSAIMKKYARGIKPGEDPLAGVNVAQTPGGQPYLADALAWLECRLAQTCEFGGDHDLLVAHITAGAVLKDGTSFTHLRGSGWHY